MDAVMMSTNQAPPAPSSSLGRVMHTNCAQYSIVALVEQVLLCVGLLLCRTDHGNIQELLK